MEIFELKPIGGQKSFYGKAQVIKENGWTFLKSYHTIVCGVDSANGFHRFWDAWSATTARHINSFRCPKMSKKEWLNCKVEEAPDFLRKAMILGEV